MQEMPCIQTILKSYIPERMKFLFKYVVRCTNLDPFIIESYSQEGEDLILGRMFEKKNGFYVDIGAHHPKRFSNTFLFYKRGWRGINIDAMPKSMVAFDKQRPRDLNLEIPIASEEKTLTYYQFNEPALNSFSERIASSVKKTYRLISRQQMKAFPLSAILEKHISSDQEIDFFSIDVEGLDLEVLQSNDWDKFCPKVVLVEQLGTSLCQAETSPISLFLTRKGYRIYAQTFNTAFYVSANYLSEAM